MPRNFIVQRELRRLVAKNPKVFLADSSPRFKFHFQMKMLHNNRMQLDPAELGR